MVLGKFHKYDGQTKYFIRNPKLEQIEHIFCLFSLNITFLYIFLYFKFK